MIAFTMSNAVFDIGLRSTSDASTCPGLFHGVSDCLDKFMIAGIVLSYLDSDTQIKAMCPYVSRSATTVTFSNGTVTVVVSDQDAVTVSVSGGGDTPGEGLPEYTVADKDKVLTVVPVADSQTEVEPAWTSVPVELPARTASDRGKVLTVVNKYVTSELISERTVTVTAGDEGGVALTDTGIGDLNNGDIVTLTVDGHEYMSVWNDIHGAVFDADSITYVLYYDNDTAMFFPYTGSYAVEPGEYAIQATATVPSTTEANINWMEPSSGIYKITAVDNEGTLVLDKDYAEIMLALSNGLYPWILGPSTLYTVIGIDAVELELYCLNSGGGKITFKAQSDSDYPVYDPLG